MMQLLVSGQTLQFRNDPIKGWPGDQVNVAFGSDWGGLTRFAQVKQGDNMMQIILDTDDRFELPNFITNGPFTIMVMGRQGSTRVTTQQLQVIGVSLEGA